MGVKILSDFDGVWTNQRDEAKHIEQYACTKIAEATGDDLASVTAAFGAFVDEVRAQPEEFGWAPTGRISAYVDEDPLLTTNSVFLQVLRGANDTARAWGEAIRAAGYEQLEQFADACFVGATKSFRAEHPPIMVDGAGETMQALLDAGADIVVVSNSRAEKLIAWLTEAGIDAGEGPEHAVRVRGNAKKWLLSDAPESIEIAGREVFVDRPAYLEALRAEAPDIVIGDVFSLDLALPSVLRERGEPGGPRQLVLRVQEHSPAWIRETRADGRIDALASHPRDLLPIVERLSLEAQA